MTVAPVTLFYNIFPHSKIAKSFQLSPIHFHNAIIRVAPCFSPTSPIFLNMATKAFLKSVRRLRVNYELHDQIYFVRGTLGNGICYIVIQSCEMDTF